MTTIDRRQTTNRAAGSSSRLIARGLRKEYGEVVAVAHVDVELHPGEVLGILGRNGAGKSTSVRLLMGLERPTAGEVAILGEPPATATRHNLVGYCSQDLAIYPTRSVAHNLTFWGELAGLSRADARASALRTAERLGLAPFLTRRANDLSGGYKRRVHLGAALVAGAPALILDEPTAGVDIESRELIVDLVRALADEGHAVLYTSHDLADVERLCDRVMILSRGTVKATGSVQELSQSVGQMVRVELDDRETRDRAREQLERAGHRARLWGSAGLEVQLERTQPASDALAMLTRQDHNLKRVEVLAPGLESIFLRMTRSDDEQGLA
jgi:ABC-2 type transport system ATP-binding protein